MKGSESVVIVGAGLAGARTAQALRDQGFTGRVTLLGEEPQRPYLRPPLSKDFLRGRCEREELFVHPRSWYADHDVDLHIGARVVGIDRDIHQVHLAHGPSVTYDTLVLATGAAPQMLPVPGADPHRVYYLRRVEDSTQLRFILGAGSRSLVVIGAGWIGMEVAAAARQAGVDVTVLEAAELPLASALGPQMAQVFADLHRGHGVDLRCGLRVEEVTGSDPQRGSGVRLSDGTQLEADVVAVGVGAIPRIELARAAGLEVEDGILVNEQLLTSDPHIYAVGDVANAYHPVLGRHLRPEHWAAAQCQPAVAVSAMLGGPAVYDLLPYFFSDQFDLEMEYYGFAEPGGYDEVVVRHDGDGFVAFWIADHQVLAAMNANAPDLTEPLWALVRNGSAVDSNRLADPAVPLEALVGTDRMRRVRTPGRAAAGPRRRCAEQ